MARVGNVRDLEHACRRYQLCAQQEQAGTPAAANRRGINIKRGADGYSTIEVTVEDVELEELLHALQAATDHLNPADGTADEAVEESPREDSAASPPRGWKKAVDALLHLIRTGLAHLGDTNLPAADRYLVHLLHHPETGLTELLDGTPLPPTTASRITCDTSTVTHHLANNNEPLALGRKTRQWNTAQHRAITIRDHGTCRFPGCTNRITDIHHLHHWTNGGKTDVQNGILLCPHHHTLTHHGYTATGNANQHVTFHRPDGTTLGATRPRG